MKPTLNILLCAMLSAVLLSAAPPASPAPAPDDFSAVDAYIQETMRRFPIPGLALAIVKGDQVLYLKGYGTANEGGDPVTPQTPFMLGSVTKTFTALAIHQLQRDGKLMLDWPVQQYIPEFRLADERAAQQITVRDLVEHISGFSTLEGNDPYLYQPGATFAGVLGVLARYRPEYAPGKHYEYSNMNYVLLKEVIERASGEPYTDYVKGHILDPLEMTHTTFADYRSIPGSATYRLATYGFSFPWVEQRAPVMLSAGWLSSTAEDMAHYMVLYFKDGQYNGQDLLTAQGPGWYDSSWVWHSGPIPGDARDAFSGGFNSGSTHMQLWHFRKLGVMVLMNTRMEEPIPGPSTYVIASDIASIMMGRSYSVHANTGYYAGWALLDAFILCSLAGLIWQVSKLRGWSRRYRSAVNRSPMWMLIALDIAIGAAALMFPYTFGVTWRVALPQRPDIGFPMLVIGVGLCAVALIKAGMAITSRAKAVT